MWESLSNPMFSLFVFIECSVFLWEKKMRGNEIGVDFCIDISSTREMENGGKQNKGELVVLKWN